MFEIWSLFSVSFLWSPLRFEGTSETIADKLKIERGFVDSPRKFRSKNQTLGNFKLALILAHTGLEKAVNLQIIQPRLYKGSFRGESSAGCRK